MGKALTKREKGVLRIIIYCSSIWIIGSVALIRIADLLLEGSSLSWKILVNLVVMIFSIILLYLGEESVISSILNLTEAVPKEDKEMVGHWSISIAYQNSVSHTEVRRTGTVLFKNNATGLTLEGNKLLDDSTGEVVVESWVSEIAEITHSPDCKTLLYSYKIRRPDNPDVFHKVGYAVAYCKSSDISNRIFRGEFFDLSITNMSSDEFIRKGKVVIFKAHR